MAKILTVQAADLKNFSGRFSRAKSRGPRHQPGQMNKTESAYSERLESLRLAGEITGWRFEAYKLRLADNTWFTPDFMVQLGSGEIELHEVKACKRGGQILIEDDAAVKLKVAAEQYTEFQFILAGRLAGGAGWKVDRLR